MAGLVIEDLEVGTGQEAKQGDTVNVHYTGWLTDGTKFDSSHNRNRTFSFTIGGRRVIAGWEQGVAGMKVGGKRKLTIPPALGYGARLLSRAPACLFRTIDIAGDGINNEGFGPEQAYAQFPFADVTVNGLVVNNSDYEAERSLISFYRNSVIYGPGAFLEIAQSFEDYERAMRRKLERELTPRAVGFDRRPRNREPG